MQGDDGNIPSFAATEALVISAVSCAVIIACVGTGEDSMAGVMQSVGVNGKGRA